MSYVLRPDQCDGRPIGGEAKGLARLTAAGFAVPDWVVVPADACRVNATGDITARRSVLDEIDGAVAGLGGRETLIAVRSSGIDEDGDGHSFAGQHDTFLFVEPADVTDRVASVWESGGSKRAAAYRARMGLGPGQPPAVVIQVMVEPDVSGVAFTADPVNGERSRTIVAAVPGVGTALVSGAADADTFHVDSAGAVVARTITSKTLMHWRDPGSEDGVAVVHLPGGRTEAPVLTDHQVAAVALAARRAESVFGSPQDVEWAIAGDHMYILQSRPITHLPSIGPSVGIWGNSNIAESYSGITTPLTYSFARNAYEHVYRELCRVMKVPASRIAEHANDFRTMIGFIHGRIYYNLLAWYRLLATFPGFSANRRFMEQMMGVSEQLPKELVASLEASSRWEKIRDGARLSRAVLALVRDHRRIERRIRRFEEHLEITLEAVPHEFEGSSADDIVAAYRHLERSLITRWDVPLVNDFLTMVFFGLFRRLAVSWYDDVDGSLTNDLLAGGSPLVSAEPAARVREMALLAGSIPGLAELLIEDPLAAVERVEADPELGARYRAYLDDFGDRSMQELKLESPSVRDDPSVLLRAVGHVAAGGAGLPTRQRSNDDRLASRPGTHVGRVRRLVFRWARRHARRRIADRERLRLQRTRVFGRVKTIFRALGSELADRGVLTDPSDVFYLETEEALGFVEGTATCTDLSALARARRADLDRFAAAPPPDDRFETRGPVNLGNSFRSVAETVGDEGQRSGLGACSGVVRGTVRVVSDPERARIASGEVLVAEQTDPGWVVLFAGAAAVVTARGSLLSHSAIVARELGIPTVVGVTGAVDWLEDGDRVEVDGQAGTVRSLDRSPSETPDAATERARV